MMSIVPDWANSSVTKNQGIEPGPVENQHQTMLFWAMLLMWIVMVMVVPSMCQVWSMVQDKTMMMVMMIQMIMMMRMLLKMTCCEANNEGDDRYDGYIGHCWNCFLQKI